MPLAPTTDSRLAALLAGKRGVREWDWRLIRSDINGADLEELPTVRGASVNIAEDREYSWELQGLSLSFLDELNLLRDFVKVEVLLRDVDEWLSFPLGLYYFDAPRGTDSPLETSWDLTGKSPEAVFMDSTAIAGFKALAGDWILGTVRGLLITRGVDPERIDFPPTSEDKMLTVDFFADPFNDAEGTRYLRIINALLAAGGFYNLYTNAPGKFRTKAIPSGAQLEPSFVFGTTEDAEPMINGDIPFEYDFETFANRVVVYSGDPDQGQVFAVAENHDPNSAVSYEALGQRWVQKDPIVLQNLVSVAEATAIARAALRRQSGANLTREVPIEVDPRRGPREIAGLDVYREDGTPVALGNWPVLAYQMPLSLEGWSMTVQQGVAL